MKRFMIWMMVSMMGTVVFGCGGEVTQPSPQEYGVAKFAVPIPKLLVNTLTRVEGVVTAADIDTLRKNLTIGADDVARGVITGILVLCQVNSDGLCGDHLGCSTLALQTGKMPVLHIKTSLEEH